jgi:hypothetical protein
LFCLGKFDDDEEKKKKKKNGLPGWCLKTVFQLFILQPF